MEQWQEDLFEALSRIPGWPKVPAVGDNEQTAKRDDEEHQLTKADSHQLFDAFPEDWLSMDADGWRSVAAGALANAVSDWGRGLSAADVVAALQKWKALRAKVDEVMRGLDGE